MLGSIEDFSRSVWAMRHGSKMNKTDVSKCICSPSVNRAIPRQQPTKINSNKNIPSSFGRFPKLMPSIYRQNHLNEVSTLHLQINHLNLEHVVRSPFISSFQTKQTSYLYCKSVNFASSKKIKPSPFFIASRVSAQNPPDFGPQLPGQIAPFIKPRRLAHVNNQKFRGLMFKIPTVRR